MRFALCCILVLARPTRGSRKNLHREDTVESIQSATALITQKLTEWGEQGILLLPNAVVAVIVILIFAVVGIFVGKGVRAILSRLLKNVSLVNFLGSLARLCVFLIGFIIALYVLKLDRAVISLLTGVGIIGIALGFAVQDIAANFISGIALVSRDERPFRVGDIVETNTHMGVVKEINLRDSMILCFDGRTVYIPNKSIFQEAVINYTTLGKRRVDLVVGVSYGENLREVKRVTLEALSSISVAEKDSVRLYYEEFGDSSINFSVRFWIAETEQPQYLEARSEAVMRIHEAYDKAGITIPFPIRTLDFGIKGGQTLTEALDERKK